jgi:hypothetical protein
MRKPRIPMRPEDVPQQRIRLVVQLPPRPHSFKGTCNFFKPIAERDRPKGSPRKLEYLGSVEWTWSPMHSRVDSYYLNPRGRYWLLWIRSREDEDWSRKWIWMLYAYGPRKGVDAKTAATYLLLDAWNAEKKINELDHWFLIDEEAFLSVAEIAEISRKVWPENYNK